MNPEEMLKRSQTRIQLMKTGGTIPCPDCKKGRIKRINDFVFSCDNCGTSIIYTISGQRNKMLASIDEG